MSSWRAEQPCGRVRGACDYGAVEMTVMEERSRGWTTPELRRLPGNMVHGTRLHDSGAPDVTWDLEGSNESREIKTQAFENF